MCERVIQGDPCADTVTESCGVTRQQWGGGRQERPNKARVVLRGSPQPPRLSHWRTLPQKSSQLISALCKVEFQQTYTHHPQASSSHFYGALPCTDIGVGYPRGCSRDTWPRLEFVIQRVPKGASEDISQLLLLLYRETEAQKKNFPKVTLSRPGICVAAPRLRQPGLLYHEAAWNMAQASLPS